MHLDVLDLKNFYYRSALGRVAQKAVRDQVLQLWPEAQGQTVAGFGFAVPLLRPYLEDARRVIGLMPGPQGVMSWPAGMKNVALLCDEMHWPLETGSVDKLVLMHGLETSETPAALLEECWRVLGPGGRMIVIVPNRAGLWARRDITPFGFGRPYSLGQLEAQLKSHSFEPERHVAALFAPPSNRRFWLKTGPVWESAGRKISSALAGGVVMVEASKQMFQPRRPGLPAAVRKPLRLLDGIAQPGVEPI
ncbi:class I SAM-dependent methyltransferase [Pseudoruegeria sp. SHC-113]|uniref:class I SAM-dependent methyltransferase n=1 Tax=Pseudoruegeria sp. SHC-113 TaxID=2855439 RepID=UPI0021BB89B0|nr:class I SAM-dependent methyltransferase [Pseudoruegeria sp. SHC-113]MCT8159613.1 class I SAM-dependent methyltransferase [Pseudoruegeria sp. SHC-113]